MSYCCLQVVLVTKAGKARLDYQESMVAPEAREIVEDQVVQDGRVPRDSSDSVDATACLEYQAPRDSEVY